MTHCNKNYTNQSNHLFEDVLRNVKMKNIHSRSFHILVLSLSSCHNHSPTRSFIFVKNTTLPVRLELETTSTGVPSRFLTTDCATIKLAEKKILRKLEFKVRVLSVLFNTVEFGVCFDITSWVAKTSFFFFQVVLVDTYLLFVAILMC